MSLLKKFCAERFKASFPLFSHNKNQNLVYLDNAATTQKPSHVIKAITNFYCQHNANAHRSSHRLSRLATEHLESVRQEVAHFINAKKEEIVFCRGATEGLNMVAHGLQHHLAPGDQIVVSAAEHHANFLPWQKLAQEKQLELIKLPLSHGAPNMAMLPQLITDRTKVLAITAASNVLGVTTALKELETGLGDYKPIVVIDAAQLALHRDINVKTFNCDFLVFSGHKMLGPLGIGVLYGRGERFADLMPWQLGGEMVDRVTWAQSDYANGTRRFEAGTLSLANIVGLGAAIEFLSAENRNAIEAHEQILLEHLHAGLKSLPSLKLLTTPENNIGIATFTLHDRCSPAKNLQDLALWLDGHDIAVRSGQHCAHPLYQTLDEPMGALRLSLAPYNLPQDIDRTLNAVSDWLSVARAPTASDQHPLGKGDPSQQPQHTTQITRDNLSQLNLDDLQTQTQWQARYRVLMQWGNAVVKKEALRLPEFQITGCEANTWLRHEVRGGAHYFIFDSESRIVRGLGALLLLWFDGKGTADILAFDWQEAARTLGLSQHLTESRRNGFIALAQSMIARAEAANSEAR